MALLSLRMRAEAVGVHLSGAERLVPEAEGEAVVAALFARGQGRGAERITITAERVAEASIREATVLPVTTLGVGDWRAGRMAAQQLLIAVGVAGEVATNLLGRLARGPVMRGAILAHAQTGERLEPDQAKGVRVSRIDYHPAFREEAIKVLQAGGLPHFRVREALAVASKVAAGGALAEVCWSDDPAYPFGYVASPAYGYVRLLLKAAGDPYGGRIFFLPPAVDLAGYSNFLERTPVLLRGPLTVAKEEDLDGFLGRAR